MHRDGPCPLDQIRTLGLTVIEVPGLADWVVWVDGYDVALIRAGLDRAGHQWCADWLIETLAGSLLDPAA